MKKEHIFVIILVVLIAGITTLAVVSNQKNNVDKNPVLSLALDKTAQCLVDGGAKFYGASWCSHCANQKALFKKSVKTLPYIECSTGGPGTPQTQVCIDAKIQSYPTWRFTDNTELSGEVSPLDLANKVSCSLDDTSIAELQIQKDELIAKQKSTQATQKSQSTTQD